MTTATFVRKLRGSWHGDARLYRLSEPLKGGQDHVVVSAVDLDFGGRTIPDYRTSETMVFPCDHNGRDVDYGEIGFVPRKDHVAALEDAGFEVSA